MNYQGWKIEFDPKRASSGEFVATKSGCAITADTLSSTERLVDRRIREETLTQVTKLKLGDLIEVQGYVMLAGLEDLCRYRLKSVVVRNGQIAYRFTKPRGRKIMVVHYAQNVDAWISDKSNEDLNKIVVIQEIPVWNKG